MKTKLDAKGYVSIHCPDHKYSPTKNGWILEHRKICEDYIGRALKRGEWVHANCEVVKGNKCDECGVYKELHKSITSHDFKEGESK